MILYLLNVALLLCLLSWDVSAFTYDCPYTGPIACKPPACIATKCPRHTGAKCVATCNNCVAKFYDRFGRRLTNECDCGEEPHECEDLCDGKTCPGQRNVECRVNRCGGCRAIFYDKHGRPVKCGPSGSICHQPKRIGPCDGYFPRYFYNSMSKTCEKFIYGGCDGNKNNFKTLGECRRKCHEQDICKLPKVVGPCEALIPRYFFNKYTKKCEFFHYGGCMGNKNNFKTLAECQKTCPGDSGCPGGKPINCLVNACQFAKCPAVPSAICHTTCFGCIAHWTDKFGNDVTEKCKTNVCSLPKVPGPCKATIPRYFYNKDIGKCEHFIYGGCQGNANNFESLVQCRDACPETAGPTCPALQPGTGGICVEACSADEDCKGGDLCCSNGCGHVCEKPAYPDCDNGIPIFCIVNACQFATCPSVPGAECRAKCLGCIEHWVDPRGKDVTDECKATVLDPSCPMVRKGDFGTCAQQCKSNKDCKGMQVCCSNGCGTHCRDKPDVCSQHKVVGPCKAKLPRYYFDSNLGKCVKFYYGGCHGNDNNFKSLEACAARCPEEDSCTHARCPRQLEAECRTACPRCEPRFYDIFNREVTHQCQCPGRIFEADCSGDKNPCKGATCPGHYKYQCRTNSCGGCTAIFYDKYGNVITCKEKPRPCPSGVPPPCMYRTHDSYTP